MDDPLDAVLARAGAMVADDPNLDSALASLARARAEEGGRRRRRARVVLPSIALGSVLALAGAVGVAATQWGPWTYVSDPDVVLNRDWVDVHGVELGSCQTRLMADSVPEDVRAEARAYLATVDVANMTPNAESVASKLAAAGRLDRLSELIPGADPDDFEFTNWAEPLQGQSDIEILQLVLAGDVFHEVVTHLRKKGMVGDVGGMIETQCTPDAGMSAP